MYPTLKKQQKKTFYTYSQLKTVLLGRAAPSGWLPFFKPILAVSFGTLLFVLGTTLSLLYFTQVGNIPYLLGPLFLAAGLMFLVTGLVWIPVLKESLEHHALIKVSHGKELQVEHKHH
uniref:Uncharacterized protein n=1 Tax=Sparus aurata TaxID=8175 RepID=A0A671UX55_SPAAU